MRVMAIVKSTPESEAGEMPSERVLTAMGAFNEELVGAGVLVAGDGLHPSTKGARIRFSPGGTDVVDGPFAETKELVAGYWILEVASMQEAIEWIRRVPNPDGEHSEIELRQVFAPEDFDYAPEVVAQEAELGRRVQEQHGGDLG